MAPSKKGKVKSPPKEESMIESLLRLAKLQQKRLDAQSEIIDLQGKRVTEISEQIDSLCRIIDIQGEQIKRLNEQAAGSYKQPNTGVSEVA